jgi:uncharacterized membrane protein YgdD (TMEM256/DUF423 family)
MHKKYAVIGVLMAALGVALGAFGAHGLQDLTSDAKIIHGYQTAVEYQQYHALAILVIALLYNYTDSRWTIRAANLLIIGVILFSGSVYLLTYLKIAAAAGVKIVGPVTPLGGLFMIAGWLALIPAIIKRK